MFLSNIASFIYRGAGSELRTGYQWRKLGLPQWFIWSVTVKEKAIFSNRYICVAAGWFIVPCHTIQKWTFRLICRVVFRKLNLARMMDPVTFSNSFSEAACFCNASRIAVCHRCFSRKCNTGGSFIIVYTPSLVDCVPFAFSILMWLRKAAAAIFTKETSQCVALVQSVSLWQRPQTALNCRIARKVAKVLVILPPA